MHKHNIENPHIKKLSAIEKIKKGAFILNAPFYLEKSERLFFLR